MKEVIIAVIAGIFSGTFFTFLQAMIARRDQKKEKAEEKTALDKEWREHVDRELEKGERDSCRQQLLILMDRYSDDTHEILQLAEHYFVDLKANFYLTTLFTKWLHERGLNLPGWVPEPKKEDKDDGE